MKEAPVDEKPKTIGYTAVDDDEIDKLLETFLANN